MVYNVALETGNIFPIYLVNLPSKQLLLIFSFSNDTYEQRDTSCVKLEEKEEINQEFYRHLC